MCVVILTNRPDHYEIEYIHEFTDHFGGEVEPERPHYTSVDPRDCLCPINIAHELTKRGVEFRQEVNGDYRIIREADGNP